MKKIILLLFLALPLVAFSQYVLKGEVVIFSFETNGGKKMMLVKAKDNSYIQYRFGTKSKIEFQYPEFRNETSWRKFEYNSY